MTHEVADILKDIVVMLYREAGEDWCASMFDRINEAIGKPSNPTP